MENHILKKSFFFFIFLSLSGCITIGVSKDPVPAKNIEFQNPESPFSEKKTKTGDKVWISKKTGNTISYLSDCSAASDLSIDNLENEALSGLEKMEIISSKEFDYNQRLAKETLAAGIVDGVKVKIWVVTFKKNACNYNLIYAGKQHSFSSEEGTFNRFKENFKAP